MNIMLGRVVCVCYAVKWALAYHILSHTLVLCVKGQLRGPLLTRLFKLKPLRSVPGPNAPESVPTPELFDYSLNIQDRAGFGHFGPKPRCMKHLACSVK